jgi:hypothetical protein
MDNDRADFDNVAGNPDEEVKCGGNRKLRCRSFPRAHIYACKGLFLERMNKAELPTSPTLKIHLITIQYILT